MISAMPPQLMPIKIAGYLLALLGIVLLVANIFLGATLGPKQGYTPYNLMALGALLPMWWGHRLIRGKANHLIARIVLSLIFGIFGIANFFKSNDPSFFEFFPTLCILTSGVLTWIYKERYYAWKTSI